MHNMFRLLVTASIIPSFIYFITSSIAFVTSSNTDDMVTAAFCLILSGIGMLVVMKLNFVKSKAL